MKDASFVWKSLLTVPSLTALMADQALSKPVNEPVSVITDSETTDPSGFKWMIVCIALLVFVAFTLIGVTIFYFTKGKKDRSA